MLVAHACGPRGAHCHVGHLARAVKVQRRSRPGAALQKTDHNGCPIIGTCAPKQQDPDMNAARKQHGCRVSNRGMTRHDRSPE